MNNQNEPRATIDDIHWKSAKYEPVLARGVARTASVMGRDPTLVSRLDLIATMNNEFRCPLPGARTVKTCLQLNSSPRFPEPLLCTALRASQTMPIRQ